MSTQAEYARKRQELALAHKAEKSELDAKHKKLKKSAKNASKSERKDANKKVLEEEQALKAKHQQQIDEFDAKHKPTETNGDLSQPLLDLNINDAESQPKISRAEKQRRKKAAQEAEMKQRIETAKAETNAMIGKSPTFLEAKCIREFIDMAGLTAVEVPSDGSCLYAAVLKSMLVQAVGVDVSSLRGQTADVLERERDLYGGFVEGDFGEYVVGVRDGSLWGGELELTIISKILNTKITVIKWRDVANSCETNNYSPSDAETTTATITYHRHLMQSEHYNGTTPKS